MPGKIDIKKPRANTPYQSYKLQVDAEEQANYGKKIVYLHPGHTVPRLLASFGGFYLQPVSLECLPGNEVSLAACCLQHGGFLLTEDITKPI